MRILFALPDPSHVGPHDSAIRELCRRGHAVHLAFAASSRQREDRAAERLAVELDGLTWGTLPTRRDEWAGLRSLVSDVSAYVRLLDRRYAGGTHRRRAAEASLQGRTALLGRLPTLPGPVVRRMLRLLRRIDDAVPVDGGLLGELERARPKVVLSAPAAEGAGWQADLLAAARALGLPTALCVASWDDLTGKGVMRGRPDRVLAWNDQQRSDVASFHGVSSDLVAAVGAPRFDELLGAKASCAGGELCRRAGLDPAEPFVLYCCAAPTDLPPRVEIRFVRAWIRALRGAEDATLLRVGVMVRPHPRDEAWSGVDLSAYGNTVVWPVRADTSGSRTYHDSLLHAAAIVGLNTGALVDAAVVGRPVYTVRSVEVADRQDGWLHRRQLQPDHGGPLVVGRDIKEHLRQLAGRLRDGSGGDPRGFARAFVRPAGVDRPAATALADAIEALARDHRPEPTLVPSWLQPTGRAMQALRALAPPLGGAPLAKVKTGPGPVGDTRRDSPDGAGGGAAAAPASSGDEAIAALLLAAKRQVAGGGPIIVGPWLGEVGYELLYWIPFLKYVMERYGVDPRRVTVVSRGGAAPWYQFISKNYVEIFDLIEPAEFRRRNEERWREQGGQKHADVSAFDHWLIDEVKRRLDLREARVIHPSLMYQLYGYAWREETSIRTLNKYARYGAFEPPDPGEDPLPLPREYVAVRFYHNRSFPENDRNRTFVNRLVQALSRENEVVLLNSGLQIDDHAEAEAESSSRVHRVDHLMSPRNNLTVQTRIIAGAKAFVGTYGGFCYLAPYYRVPAVGFYSHPQHFWPIHHEQAHRVFRKLMKGSLLTLQVDDLDLLGLLSGGQTLRVP